MLLYHSIEKLKLKKGSNIITKADCFYIIFLENSTEEKAKYKLYLYLIFKINSNIISFQYWPNQANLDHF